MSVTVDDHFVRCGCKSYAINKITSIEVREVRPNETSNIAGFSLLAAIFTICGLALLPLGIAFLSLGVGVICGIVALASFGRSQHVRYILVLVTSSAEAEAFSSDDREEVLRLREKIEAAIASHAS